MIGEAVCEKNASDAKIKHLLLEYYNRKSYSFKIAIRQHVLFIGLYILANCTFLVMSGFLTLKGYITIPQFLASEIIFSLVFAKLGEFSKNLKNIYELLNITKKINESSKTNIKFEIQDIGLPFVNGNLKKFLMVMIAFLIIVFCSLFVIPWYQTSNGNGKIIAYNQEDRMQDITAMVSGRITSWYVNDGQFLKKGEKIAEISDNDPELMIKLEREFQSVKEQYENSKLATQTGKINYNRQEELYKKGIASRKDFEKAKIEYQKLLSYENEVNAKLMQVDVKFARQKSQVVVAPKDGFLLQSTAKSVSNYVYAGEKIATFVPKITEPAIEAFIHPNDIPLIHSGRKARIQIEGWPALRISGWPSTSLGTFGGIVKIVDTAISSNGMFRVIIVQDPQDSPWPEMKYIKQGTKVKAWIRMNKVSIGYEIWRQINGFPIHPDEPLFTYHDKK
jgi:multidrug resistance efflux pump